MSGRHIYISILFLVASLQVSAQPGFSVSPRLGYPFDMARDGFHNTPSIGMNFQLSYELKKSNLYPSLSFTYNSVQLSLYSEDFDILSTRGMINHVDLNLNARLNNKQSIIIGTIGLTVGSVRPNRISVETNGGTKPLVLSSDGHNYLFPGINGGIQYLRQSRAFKSLYAGLTFNVVYINAFEHSNYAVSNQFSYADVTLAQHILFPSIGIKVKYTLNNLRDR